MSKLLQCRRSIIALVGMVLLFILALVNKEDVSSHLVSIVMAVCAANSAQGAFETHSNNQARTSSDATSIPPT
jgi:hypothetical protein